MNRERLPLHPSVKNWPRICYCSTSPVHVGQAWDSEWMCVLPCGDLICSRCDDDGDDGFYKNCPKCHDEYTDSYVQAFKVIPATIDYLDYLFLIRETTLYELNNSYFSRFPNPVYFKKE